MASSCSFDRLGPPHDVVINIYPVGFSACVHLRPIKKSPFDRRVPAFDRLARKQTRKTNINSLETSKIGHGRVRVSANRRLDACCFRSTRTGSATRFLGNVVREAHDRRWTRANHDGTRFLRVLTLRSPRPHERDSRSWVSWYIGLRVCRLTRSVAPPRKPDDTPVTISIRYPSTRPDLRHPLRPTRQRQASAPWRQRVLSSSLPTYTSTPAWRTCAPCVGDDDRRIRETTRRLRRRRCGQRFPRPKLCHSDESNV